MRRFVSLAVLISLGSFLALLPGIAPASSQKAPHVCQGTASKPGVLTGRYGSGVVVNGVCQVNSGPATVTGTLKLDSGSVLIAAFGKKGSKLTVKGGVTVGQGATFVLGCNTTSFPCVDDPNQSKPTLMSPGAVTGDVTSNSPLGVIIHSTTVGGDITQTGGGGGPSCTPPKTGPFASFHSPVFSDYEDNTITGDLTVTKLNSCYLGIFRNHVTAMKVTYDTLSDPDAIEIGTNVIKENLACWHDKQHVWDSSETSMTGAIYPRQLHRNTVHGKRLGQCQKAGPLTQGGPPAGGPF
jgi:hypothetical protein